MRNILFTVHYLGRNDVTGILSIVDAQRLVEPLNCKLILLQSLEPPWGIRRLKLEWRDKIPLRNKVIRVAFNTNTCLVMSLFARLFACLYFDETENLFVYKTVCIRITFYLKLSRVANSGANLPFF